VNPLAAEAGWDYFKISIDATSAPSSFWVEVTYSGSSTWTGYATLDLIDDISFYPDHSTLTTFTYDMPYGAATATTRDKTSYTVYDNLGRVKYVMDRDKSIVRKNSYYFNPGN
jgi:hypothetical protein